MWVSRKVGLAAPSVRNVRVELGRGEIRMTEHLLDASQVRAALESEAATLEADSLADAQTRAVEELDERLVAQGPWRRAVRGFDETFCLAGRERARQASRATRRVDLGGRVVFASADQLLVPVEG